MNWVIFSLFFPLWSSIEKCTYIWCGLKNISSPFLARGHTHFLTAMPQWLGQWVTSSCGTAGPHCSRNYAELCKLLSWKYLKATSIKDHLLLISWKRQLVSYLLPPGGDVVLLVTVNLLLNPRAFLSAVFEWVCQKINNIGFLHSFASFSLLSFWSV